MDVDPASEVVDTPTPEQANAQHDLVGGSFAVIESDPGVFTTLLRTLGVQGLEVTEIIDISDPFAGNSLNPRGLIFCYPCSDEEEEENEDADAHGLDDEVPDPDAEDVWFAHQLSNDACASHAIVNIVLNLENVRLRGPLDEFRRDTEKMSPAMKGLAFTNCAFIREAHNALARPADTRAALHAAARSAISYSKKSSKTKKSKAAQDGAWEADQDSYHFIGYVPAHGKVWELNGLRTSGPLEVGEIPDGDPGGLKWMDIVRPALRKRMKRLQEDEHIRYNLLAIVEDQYEKVSDTLEMLKRERKLLERRLDEAYPDGWKDKVDQALLVESATAFTTSVLPSGAPGTPFSTAFGSDKLDMEMTVLDIPVRKLIGAWQTCVTKAKAARFSVEDELRAAERTHTDHLNRTFDYEPFIQSFITSMHREGLIEPILTGAAAGDTGTADDATTGTANGSRKKSKR